MCGEKWWTHPCVASVAHFSLVGALSRVPELALMLCFTIFSLHSFLLPTITVPKYQVFPDIWIWIFKDVVLKCMDPPESLAALTSLLSLA